jgi:3-deoxy-D-manno-octulosonic-acid transferase
MKRFYTALLYLLMPALLLRLFWRSLRAPDYRRRIGERFGYLPQLTGTPTLWIHAVSVGEVQASAPLIQRLLQAYPALPVLVTTTTPTGSRRLRDLLGEEVLHVYAPYDVPLVVRRFLNAAQPRLAVFMETEVWPNILCQCAQRQIPSVLANARLSARSAAGYRRLGCLARETFARLSVIAAQTDADAARFLALGARAEAVAVTGSIKFDARLSPSLREQSAVIKRVWGEDRPVWIAASTHEGEDEQVLEAHRQVLARHANALLVLVPRHPERFNKVAQLVLRQGFSLVRRSRQEPCEAHIQVFLGDSMGELPMFFAAADVAFVGGSLVEHGGHNLLEPASAGVPVVTGPHLFNFKRISELLLAEQAAVKVMDARQLAATVSAWLGDASLRAQIGENGWRVVQRNRGALERLMDLIRGVLQADVAQRELKP